MEKRALIAVAISLAILIGYQLLVSHYYPAPPPQIDAQREQKQPETPPPSQEEKAKPQAPEKFQEKKPQALAKAAGGREITVETDDYVAIFTSQGARLKSLTLKHYRASVSENSPALEMIPSVPGIPYPLGLEIPGAPPFSDEGVAYTVQGGDQRLSGDQQGRLVFQGEGSNGISL